MSAISSISAVQRPQYLAQLITLKSSIHEFMKIHNKFEIRCELENVSKTHLLDDNDYAFIVRLSTILDSHLDDVYDYDINK